MKKYHLFKPCKITLLTGTYSSKSNRLSKFLGWVLRRPHFRPDGVTSGATRPQVSKFTLGISKFVTVYVVQRGYLKRSRWRRRRTQLVNCLCRIRKPWAIESRWKWRHAAAKFRLRRTYSVTLDTGIKLLSESLLRLPAWLYYTAAWWPNLTHHYYYWILYCITTVYVLQYYRLLFPHFSVFLLLFKISCHSTQNKRWKI